MLIYEKESKAKYASSPKSGKSQPISSTHLLDASSTSMLSLLLGLDSDFMLYETSCPTHSRIVRRIRLASSFRHGAVLAILAHPDGLPDASFLARCLDE